MPPGSLPASSLGSMPYFCSRSPCCSVSTCPGSSWSACSALSCWPRSRSSSRILSLGISIVVPSVRLPGWRAARATRRKRYQTRPVSELKPAGARRSAFSQAILSAVLVRSPSLERMDHTDRRSAHRRVGAATIAAFLVLLLLGATRGPAQADTTVPAPAATAAPTVEPVQPLPADPDPGYPEGPRFGHPRGGGFGDGAPHDGGGDGGFGDGAPDGGGDFGGGSSGGG